MAANKSAFQNRVVMCENVAMTTPLLPDERWTIVEPLRPPEPPNPTGGRPRVPDRAALTGIIVVLTSGIPGELLPQDMGCGSGVTCWRRRRDGQAAGVWDRLPQTLRDRRGEAGRSDWERAWLDRASIPANRGAMPGDRTPPIAANQARTGLSSANAGACPWPPG